MGLMPINYRNTHNPTQQSQTKCVYYLCHPPDLGCPPRAGLQLVQFEEQLGFLRVVERAGDGLCMKSCLYACIGGWDGRRNDGL